MSSPPENEIAGALRRAELELAEARAALEAMPPKAVRELRHAVEKAREHAQKLEAEVRQRDQALVPLRGEVNALRARIAQAQR